jgi:predicted HD phosphohydrolase
MTEFKRLQDATPADWAEIARIEEGAYNSRNAGAGLLRLLELQRDDPDDGWPINLYRHCLQSATLAHRAGADEELIFCALFHDACEIVAPFAHGAATAGLLAPYISEDRVCRARFGRAGGA